MTTLLLDMDGPLADFDGEFWRRCTAEGWAFDIDDPASQAFRFFTEHMPNAGERRSARRMVDAAGWFEELPPTPGAVDGVAELLKRDDLDVWVCTKPLEVNPTCRDAKAGWLRRHLPGLEHRLIVAPDKSLVYGDVLLDDAPPIEWCNRAFWRPVIFDAPFNRAGSEWDELPRWTWSDGVDRLVELTAEVYA